MELPNLNQIVDTFFKIKDTNFIAYISQLRNDLIPVIRNLQRNNDIIWYSFLIHDSNNIRIENRIVPNDEKLVDCRQTRFAVIPMNRLCHNINFGSCRFFFTSSA